MLVVAALSGCASGTPEATTISSTTVASVEPSPPPGSRICTAGKSSPPASAVSYSVVGQTGTDWELPTGRGRTVDVRASVRSNAVVTTIQFEVVPDGPSPSETRILGSATNWKSGDHLTVLRWDGRDATGKSIPAGRYRLFVKASTRVLSPVVCADGKGSGFELSGGGEALGLGVLVAS